MTVHIEKKKQYIYYEFLLPCQKHETSFSAEFLFLLLLFLDVVFLFFTRAVQKILKKRKPSQNHIICLSLLRQTPFWCSFCYWAQSL